MGQLRRSWQTWGTDSPAHGFTMTELEQEIHRRLRQLFQRLAEGDDAPPAMRLRLEGMREAAVLSGVCSADQLQAMMDLAHRDVYGQTLSQRFGKDWARYQPFPEVPAFAARAPVTVTTRD